MGFREAIDGLCEKVGHEDIAEALGVSLQAIRQARLNGASKARRSPPEGWQEAVLRLAEDRLAHYRLLIESLSASSTGRSERDSDKSGP